MRFGKSPSALRPRSFRPSVESLEDRQCLSATLTTIALEAGGNRLKIVDDAATATTINILDQGNGHVEVTYGDGSPLGSADDVKAIRYEGKAGADTVNYTLVNPLTNSQKVVLALGAGADQANIDLLAGIADAELHLTVLGGAGKDTVGVQVGSLSASRLVLDLDGEDGQDAISVIATAVAIDADSVLRANLSGGVGKDALNLTFHGQVLGKLNYEVKGEKGQDTIVGQITLSPGSTGIVRAIEAGGKAADNVTLNVVDESAEEESTLAKLNAKIRNRNDKDTLTNTDNVTVVSVKPKAKG